MILRILLRILITTFILLLTLIYVMAQEVNSLKSAVVKIKNTKNGETGAGFIVKIDKNLIYIVAASSIDIPTDRHSGW